MWCSSVAATTGCFTRRGGGCSAYRMVRSWQPDRAGSRWFGPVAPTAWPRAEPRCPRRRRGPRRASSVGPGPVHHVLGGPIIGGTAGPGRNHLVDDRTNGDAPGGCLDLGFAARITAPGATRQRVLAGG